MVDHIKHNGNINSLSSDIFIYIMLYNIAMNTLIDIMKDYH